MKLEKLMSTLKLDRHHAIERFGVLFFVLCILMTTVTTTIIVRKNKMSNQALDKQVMYTTEFVTSVTGQTGVVENIYTNEANTKVFLLLKFDDMSKMSTDAKNYQMFLTGSSPNLRQTKLMCNPSSCIYMFGSTGYMGIYLVDSKGFDKQILDLVVRCNSELASRTDGVSAEAQSDGSFADYDQFRIYFNPGGFNCPKADVLDSKQMTVSSIYEALVSRAEEQEIRKKLQSDLETMQTDLRTIKEYTERVERDGIVVPDVPSYMKGDTVKQDEDGVLRLTTDSIIEGGYDFNWQDGSVKDGYLDALCDGLSYEQFFAMKKQETIQTDTSRTSTSNMKWYYQDGSEFDGTVSEIGLTATINNDISLLTSAWQTYMNHKQTYQSSDLKELLLLEVNTRSVDANYTIHDGEDVLTKY